LFLRRGSAVDIRPCFSFSSEAARCLLEDLMASFGMDRYAAPFSPSRKFGSDRLFFSPSPSYYMRRKRRPSLPPIPKNRGGPSTSSSWKVLSPPPPPLAPKNDDSSCSRGRALGTLFSSPPSPRPVRSNGNGKLSLRG